MFYDVILDTYWPANNAFLRNKMPPHRMQPPPYKKGKAGKKGFRG